MHTKNWSLSLRRRDELVMEYFIKQQCKVTLYKRLPEESTVANAHCVNFHPCIFTVHICICLDCPFTTLGVTSHHWNAMCLPYQWDYCKMNGQWLNGTFMHWNDGQLCLTWLLLFTGLHQGVVIILNSIELPQQSKPHLHFHYVMGIDSPYRLGWGSLRRILKNFQGPLISFTWEQFSLPNWDSSRCGYSEMYHPVIHWLPSLRTLHEDRHTPSLEECLYYLDPPSGLIFISKKDRKNDNSCGNLVNNSIHS